MRNNSKGTPRGRRSLETESSAQEKKLVQARLPFKIIATDVVKPGGAAEGVGIDEARTKDGSTGLPLGAQKRKLSEGDDNDAEVTMMVLDGDDNNPERSSSSCSKENLMVVGGTSSKKKKTADATTVVADIVVLDDDSSDGDNEREDDAKAKGSSSAKNIKKSTATTTTKTRATMSPRTPQLKFGKPSSGAGTPASGGKKIQTTTGGTGGGGVGGDSDTKSNSSSSASKTVQIKLPMTSNSKNKTKRRKSAQKTLSAQLKGSTVDATVEVLVESSDDLEMIADELNPQKRKRVDNETVTDVAIADEKTFAVQQVADVKKTVQPAAKETEEKHKQLDDLKLKDPTAGDLASEDSLSSQKSSSDENQDQNSSPEKDTEVLENEEEEEKEQEADATKDDDDEDNDDDDEEEDVSDDQQTESDAKMLNSSSAIGELASSSTSMTLIQKKNLTPKQHKLMEQRRRAREDKERKLNEEKLQKQREKEEKETARKREREEKEEQRRREREEKEDQRRKEREEKERKRLAEIEAKNEEKRKRTEAKEDERKRKEHEKEEAANKKKKVAESFKKWFRPDGGEQPTKHGAAGIVGLDDDTDMETLAFRPFRLKEDMTLAPVCRKVLIGESRGDLDVVMRAMAAENGHDNDNDDNDNDVARHTVVAQKKRKSAVKKTHLYLAELKADRIVPQKWKRPVADEKKGESDSDNDTDDVMIVEDELERAGQAIVEENHDTVEHLRAKFYKFTENRRPPFRGTWRKKTALITPRRPFAQDTKYFDYEVDSDLEWEEEEPGESLDGSDDDKEKEGSDDDDYEVDNEWFVPHGHLSDEEMQNEDELGGDNENNDREAQKAKLKLLQHEFTQQMKKKTEKIKPRLIGCIWVDQNGNQPELCPKIIWDTLHTRAMMSTIAPLLEEPEQPEKSDANDRSPSNGASGGGGGGGGGGAEKTADKLKPLPVTDDMLNDLVRLVHGNTNAKAFLIKEFIAHIETTVDAIRNGDARVPLKSAVREKIDELAEWQVTELIDANQKTNKKKTKKRLCWVVADDVLKRMNLLDLSMHNNCWEYTLAPKNSTLVDRESNKEAADVSIVVPDIDGGDSTESTEKTNAEQAITTTTTTTPPSGEKSTKSQEDHKMKRRSLVAAIVGESSPKKQRTDAVVSVTPAAIVSPPSKARRSTITKATTPNAIATTPTTPTAAAATPTTTATKKRVPLLMSVARGQQISQPIKNELISKYLKQHNTASEASKTENKKKTTKEATSSSANDDAMDEGAVIVLD